VSEPYKVDDGPQAEQILYSKPEKWRQYAVQAWLAEREYLRVHASDCPTLWKRQEQFASQSICNCLFTHP